MAPDNPTLHPCVECGDRIKAGCEEPATMDPDASPICRNCAWPDLLEAKSSVGAKLQEALAALHKIKQRIHFIGWPAEPMTVRRDGAMVPDWRAEIATLEAAITKAEGR